MTRVGTILVDDGNDVEDIWTEVARGATGDELLRQLRGYIWKDESQETTGPPPASPCEAWRAGPTFRIHVDGEAEDEDILLFNATLEDVATTAEQIQKTTTSEREERKEIEELREAQNDSDLEVPDSTETDRLKVA